MTHIIDRRLNPSGKSLTNRQKFIERARGAIRKAVKDKSGATNIREIMDGGKTISIPIDGIDEPFFHHGQDGINERVLPGNKKFIEGDSIPRPEGGGGGGGREAGDGDSMDQFQFTLTKEEFLDLFLSDLELPDLVKRKLLDTEHEGWRRAGYSITGSPSRIDVRRTLKYAKGRTIALHRPSEEEIEVARLRAEKAFEDTQDEGIWAGEYVKYLDLLRRSGRIPFIDPIDLRYRRYEPKPRPSSQAVMFMLMDVSGSMSEEMKDLAKRFYMLLYIFLERCYSKVDTVFIRHTDEAEEVDEKTFFYSQESGGTRISPALELMESIIKERYPLSAWNIYGAQSSDGDNHRVDNGKTKQLMLSSILPMSQYFAYLEVDEPQNAVKTNKSNLWETYEEMQTGSMPFAMRRVTERSEIYPVFRDLFKKRVY